MQQAEPAQTASHPEPGIDAASHEFESQCVAFFGEVVQIFNIPRSVGLIYGLLFASPNPISFTDITERLDISKGSASQGLQLLRALGAVHDADRGDPRRQLFVPELSLRKLINALLKEKVEPVIQAGTPKARALRLSAERVSHHANREFYLDRVHQIESWRKQIQIVLPILRIF